MEKSWELLKCGTETWSKQMPLGKWCDTLAWCRVATNLWFVKIVTYAKHNKVKRGIYIYYTVFFDLKKEGSLVIYKNIHETREHYAKQYKPTTER